jgi:hypothetical protein
MVKVALRSFLSKYAWRQDYVLRMVPTGNVADPDPVLHFDADADPGPTYYSHADPDPDPTFQFDADPDP